MTTCALPAPAAGGVATFPPGDGGKIIQRILPARLSDPVKEGHMGDPDHDLVLQCQQGDPVAFETLVSQHQRMIHSLTFRMTGSAADAEDLAQETFIRAFDQLDTFRGSAKFSTWLYRIAVNICLNWRQSEARRFRLRTACADETITHNPNAENGPAKNGVCEQVQAALLRLPAKQRAAIVLTIYDGMNHAEAAQALGCSETTVSWRVFAARRKLKRWLTAAGGVR